MKDFNKMIEEQIRKNKKVEEKAVAIELMDGETASDKEKRFNEKMDELYFKFFVDTTLVKIIEDQIKRMTCEADIYKPFQVSIDYDLYRVNRKMLGEQKEISSIRGMYVRQPFIGSILEIDGNDVSDRDMYLVCNILPNWTLLENVDSFDTWNISENYNSKGQKYTNFSFTSSLQRLIDMYYVEKERQEERIRLNNGLKK